MKKSAFFKKLIENAEEVFALVGMLVSCIFTSY